MKNLPTLGLSVLLSALAFIAIPAPLAHAIDTAPAVFKNESEAGVVVTAGNAPTQTFNFKQANTYEWSGNLFKGSGSYLKSSTRDTETALTWSLGLRYERVLIERLNAFLGQSLESNRFAGFYQRYNSDVGGKYFLFKGSDATPKPEDDLVWSLEGGYRFTVENRSAEQVQQHYLRLFSDTVKNWSKTFSTRLWVEYLPNLSDTSDHQLNSELSANAALSEVFAIKVGYLVKYRTILLPPATEKLDSQFTTALVAKL